MNPNKELWEKGDFTQIASTIRKSGEDLIGKLSVTKGLKILDLGCGDGGPLSKRNILHVKVFKSALAVYTSLLWLFVFCRTLVRNRSDCTVESLCGVGREYSILRRLETNSLA